MLALLTLLACQEPWDGTFPEAVARPEHPRPDLRRDSYINLNTAWQFAWDPDNIGVDEGWQARDDVWEERIQLPFAWESPLSGLGALPERYSPAWTADAHTYRGVAWYRLALPGPLPRGEDWYLVFGAVDFDATVWVDGVEVARHRGGYGPFSANLSAAASGEAPVITLRAEDWTELNDRAQPVGKQGGTWYTRVSGVWQTVYLEQRPEAHLTQLTVLPDGDAVSLRWQSTGDASATAEVRLDGLVVGEGEGDGSARIPLDTVRRWSPERPTLYELDLTLASGDRVHRRFGMANAGVDWLPGRSPDEAAAPTEQGKAFTLNGEPVFLRCVLDQSWWPDGLMTAPSLDAIRGDLQLAKDLGFNCLRLHIKPEEPVKLDLIDEMGFLVVYDLPSLDMATANTEGFAGRALFEETLREAVGRDASHPSLLMWTVFNENWGLSANGSLASPAPLAADQGMQTWVQEMVDLTKTLDPTHPVEDNSAGGIVGVFEHLGGDSNSFHWYEDDATSWRAFLDEQDALTFPGSTANYVGGTMQDGAPWWNSEFAAFSFLGSPSDAICDLWPALNELRRRPRLCGFVLTQLTDVEYELNGLVTFDRQPRDLCERQGVALPDLLGADFIGWDWLPGQRLTAGEQAQVPLWISHWSDGAALDAEVRVGWFGEEAQPVAVSAAPWDNTPLTAALTAPTEAGEHALVAELWVGGARVAANRLPVTVE
ncbi:MAG: hypothetical protein JXX28_02360 [Deltaproteobacteria bacterium]|nr:hypothetical protein [Deltaproteobacteria bacterium]